MHNELRAQDGHSEGAVVLVTRPPLRLFRRFSARIHPTGDALLNAIRRTLHVWLQNAGCCTAIAAQPCAYAAHERIRFIVYTYFQKNNRTPFSCSSQSYMRKKGIIYEEGAIFQRCAYRTKHAENTISLLTVDRHVPTFHTVCVREPPMRGRSLQFLARLSATPYRRSPDVITAGLLAEQ